MENNSLLSIFSSYILKQIFSNIEYNRFISLIKYSKEYQKKLGFNLKNNIHYNKTIEKNTKVNLATDQGDGLGLIAALPIFGPHYIYFIIYYILNKAAIIELNNDDKSNGFFWRTINGIIIKRLSILLYIGSIHVLYHTIDHSRFDYINAKKNFSENYYFLHEALLNISNSVYDKYLENNYIINDLDLINIYLSKAENYVVVWGHMETQDHFICLSEGTLEFILIPPQEKKYIYPFTKRGPINYSRVNFFDSRNNIHENYPDFFKANKLYINLSTGECLYIPSFWWRSYRTSKRKNIKTTFLTYKYKSNSNYLEHLMYIKNDF